MSAPEFMWAHVIIHTRGAWLPGDPRGFRSRNHKIHSSGDYKRRPPRTEHAGLYRYSRILCPTAITIPVMQRGCAGEAILGELRRQSVLVLALAVGGQHIHFLAKIPTVIGLQWDLIGDCKRVASYAVRAALPGSIWGRKGHVEPVRTRGHQLFVLEEYIPEHGADGVWMWDFRKGVLFDPTPHG